MNISRFVVVTFFIIISYSATNTVLALENFSTCDIRGNIQYGDFIVTNNAWGINKFKGDSETAMICISSNLAERDAAAMRVIWNIGETQNTVLAYPRISYGWDFSDNSSTSNLPIKISEISYLISKIKYKMKSNDNFNVSYDIWLSNQEIPKKNDLKVELMIWTDWQNAISPGKKISTIQLGDETYDVYKGKVSVGDWDYIALVINYKKKETIVKSLTETIKHEIQSSKSIDIKKVLMFLKQQKMINEDYFLNGISFGSEIMGGSGILNIESFQVKMLSN